MKLTISEENYIKNIYRLQSESDKVNTNALAAELNTKAASVTDMLKKLKTKKLLQYEKYYGFKLNEKGRTAALGIIRRHRLWEFFLVDKLGFEWDKVHVIAEELEHVSSPDLIKKLDSFLGNPTIDPHGDPIPDINGKVAERKQVNLNSVPLKKLLIVSSVSNHSGSMLEMLRHYGIAINSKIRVNKIFAFDKSMEIKVSTKPACIISEQVAKNIFVYDEQ